MEFAFFKVFLLLAFAQHAVAGHGNSLVASSEDADIRIIADIVKTYTTKIDENRRVVSLKFTATSTGQLHKQFDLMEAVLAATSELNVSYTFLDLDFCPHQLSDFRSLNVMFVDSAQIFW